MEADDGFKYTWNASFVQSQPHATANEKTMESPAPQQWKATRRVNIIFLGQLVVLFAISMDISILTATLPTVSDALGANAVSSFWIAAAYLLANAVVQPLIASMADIFGRRSVIFVALALFTIGSTICAVARNVATMLAGRTVQGIGGGGVLSVNLIIVSDLVPLNRRPSYISVQQLVVAIGINIAPIIGGAIVKHTTWRWLFYINLPFCAMGLVLIPFLLVYERPQSKINNQLSKVDWIGSIMFIAGMTSFLVGLTWGGTQWHWGSAATLVPMIAGLAVVLATGFYEHFIATVHFLRLSLFATWSAVAIYICAVLQNLTLFAQLYFLVLYFITVKLYSPIQAGIYILAYNSTCVPVSGLVGPIIQRLGRYRWAIWSGWVITTVALGVLVLLDEHTSTYAWVLMSITAGIGQGLLFIAHSVATQAASQSKDAAHAMSMYSFARSLGVCLGVAIGGTVFSNFLDTRLAEHNLPAEAKNAEAFAAVLRLMESGPLKDGIVEAYAWSFHRLFATLCGISSLGLVISFFIGGHTLDQKHETEHRLRDAPPSAETRV